MGILPATRVYRDGVKLIEMDEPPLVGPKDRDWWTIEIDVIPTDGETPTYIRGTIVNRCTGEALYAEARVEDYIDYYRDAEPNPHGHTPETLAEGEAIGTLFAFLRDTFETVKEGVSQS